MSQPETNGSDSNPDSDFVQVEAPDSSKEAAPLEPSVEELQVQVEKEDTEATVSSSTDQPAAQSEECDSVPPGMIPVYEFRNGVDFTQSPELFLEST